MSGIVALRPLTLNDTENIVKWRNKPAVRKNLYSQATLTPEQHIRYYHTMVETGRVRQFVIVVREDNKVCDIGSVFLKNLDAHSQKAEFGIFIGEDAVRGKGYGKQAVMRTLDYAFDELRLNRVYLTVMADNTAAVKAYEKSGFAVEGVMKEDYLRDGSFVDIIMMGVTRKVWKERNKSNGTDQS
jgi:UDP-4-amino-4,6-dideoxy-N-acetyl-beta-L-altrosamine N-acetyltransferase